MSVPYTEFRWFYPPRSASRIPYDGNPVLKMWKGYSDARAQYKMNGTNAMVVCHPNRSIELWSRHKEHNIPQKIKNYLLPMEMRHAINAFTPSGTFTIYNAELLHHKTTNVKNTLYFFDTLVYDGQYLTGVNYQDRHKIIWENLQGRTMPLHEQSISDQMYVAHNMPASEWDAAWEQAQPSTYCEGLVLKRLGPTSILQRALRERNNEAFLCRIRKPTKNYQH